MANEARIELNVDAELAELALELGFMAEQGAEFISEEIKALIPLSDQHAPPGMPPHSRGPYRDSWNETKAKRKGDLITAWAFSTVRVGVGTQRIRSAGKSRGRGVRSRKVRATHRAGRSGVPLAIVLDQGLGRVHPHPHIRQAERAAQARMDQLISRLRRGA
jgi:hypothetical protein